MRIFNFLSSKNRGRNNTSGDGFWDNFPLISSLIITAIIFMFLAYRFELNSSSDSSFFDSVHPSLNEIRDGRYLGLLTSNLLETNIIFLVWAISWFLHHGKTIENHVNIFFYIFLVISSMIFSSLSEILIFQGTSYGPGGGTLALFGFTWVMAVYEPFKWSVSYTEKLSFLIFIFLNILVDYIGIYEAAIGGLIGGFIWGVFVGFVTRSIKGTILQISILILVLGAFFIPVLWAPWQTSWLIHEAEKYEKQNKFEEAKGMYSNVLKRDSENEDAKRGLASVLTNEVEQHYKQRDYKKAKVILDKILEIDPNNESAKYNLQLVHITELEDEAEQHYKQRDYKKAKDTLDKILEIDPNSEFAKELLKDISSKPE